MELKTFARSSFGWLTWGSRGGLLCAVTLGSGALIGGCGPEEQQVTRQDFCDKWAHAACSKEVVSVCQASSPSDCQITQLEICLDNLPEDFVDRGVDGCIEAVKNAYADADLTSRELDIVERYGGPCSEIVIGNDTGEKCTTDADCEPALSCVLKDEDRGTCQDPVIIDPGFSCSAPDETCKEGFYCDGKNCIAALEEDDDCQNDHQCGTDMYCDDTCTNKLAVGKTCKSDAQCMSGICYDVDGDKTCVDRLRLSPAEPKCDSLR